MIFNDAQWGFFIGFFICLVMNWIYDKVKTNGIFYTRTIQKI